MALPVSSIESPPVSDPVIVEVPKAPDGGTEGHADFGHVGGGFTFSPHWLSWLIRLWHFLNTIQNMAIPAHDLLLGVQGYDGTHAYHLGLADYNLLTGGPTTDASSEHGHYEATTQVNTQTLSTSPFTYTNSGNYLQLASIVGGTGVQVGYTSSGSLIFVGTNVLVPLAPNDEVVVSWTSTAPTVIVLER